MNKKLPEWCRKAKKTLIDQGMSARQLADETGYSYSTISMILNGRYSGGGRREIEKKIDSVLCAEGIPKLPQWYRDVKNAMRDTGISVRQLAEKTGYSVTTISSIINGRYSRRNYQAVADRINNVLGTEGLPERIFLVSDEWHQQVKIGLIKKNMTVSRLAEAVGVTRDKMSLVINGKMMDQQIVNEVNRLLDLAPPKAFSETSKL